MNTNISKDSSAQLSSNILNSRTIRVWDMPTRVFHWSLVTMVAIAWVSAEADGSLFVIHVVSATTLVGFVVFRLLWGVIGSRHARFSDFVYPPHTVRDYAVRLMSFRPPHVVGHNPIGGWMILALLAALFVVVISGLMTSEDGYVGPLSHLAFGGMDDLHEALANMLGLLIVLHVIGVLGHSLISRENLIRAMITGNKTTSATSEKMMEKGIADVGFFRPVIAVVAGIGAVWLFWG